jgi:hypothetical protein
MTEKEQIALMLTAAIIQAQASMAGLSPIRQKNAEELVQPGRAIRLYRDMLAALDLG